MYGPRSRRPLLASPPNFPLTIPCNHLSYGTLIAHPIPTTQLPLSPRRRATNWRYGPHSCRPFYSPCRSDRTCLLSAFLCERASQRSLPAPPLNFPLTMPWHDVSVRDRDLTCADRQNPAILLASRFLMKGPRNPAPLPAYSRDDPLRSPVHMKGPFSPAQWRSLAHLAPFSPAQWRSLARSEDK